MGDKRKMSKADELKSKNENLFQRNTVLINQLEEKDRKIQELEKENAVLKTKIERAKECMKKLLFIIKSDPANYNCKGLIQDAEDFIYNRTCHIRQLGEHCITEERCIMCDK